MLSHCFSKRALSCARSVSYTHLINYAVASREDKEAMFLEYSELLNSLDSGATTKITIKKMCIRDRSYQALNLVSQIRLLGGSP